MSIHYLDHAGNPIVLDRVEDLFDPRKNNRYNDDGIITIDWWKKTLNALFCRENLLNIGVAKYLLFDGGIGPTVSEIEHFLELTVDIAPEDHWLFAFIKRRGRIDQGGSRLIFLHPSYISSSRSSFEFDTDSFSGDLANIEVFKTNFTLMKERWTSSMRNHNQAQAMWASNYIPNVNNFVNYFKHYSANLRIFISPSGSSAHAVQVLRTLNDNPNVSLQITLNNGTRDINLILKENVSRTNRQPLYEILQYSANPLNILPYPNTLPKEKGSNPVLVGVELEVSTDYSMKQLVDAAEDPFFIGKMDSSISGSKNTRVELVTAPSSFKYLKRQYALWFNKLDYTKFDVTTTTNNGMHVHIGREHFEDNTHIRNFCWFWNNPANTDFIVYLSERGSQAAMEHYSPIYRWGNGVSRTRAFKEVYHFLGNGFRGITNFKGGWENAKTVEVRAFRGIVSYASIVKNLEAVEAIFNFTRGLTSYRELGLSSFFKWLAKTPPNRYAILKKFISQGNENRWLIASEVKDIIFTETDEDRILLLLKKSNITLTNEHLRILNRGKKRTFTLNKETGQIEITYHNRSKLHHLDKIVAERYLRTTTAA